MSSRCGDPPGRRRPDVHDGAMHAHAQVMRRYHIQDRDDYKKYNKIVGMVTKLTNVLKQLDAKDATRIELTEQLLNKQVNEACMHACHVDTLCRPSGVQRNHHQPSLDMRHP